MELLLDWIAALRAGDLDGIAELLTPDVVWQGATTDLHCTGRGAVLDVIAEQIPLCLQLDALELIAAPPHLVLGTRSQHLPDPPGTQLAGQIYNVFEHDGLKILHIRDFATRPEALHAAGLPHASGAR